METFGARPEAPLTTCLAEVDQSDVYVGIIAFRLGSIDRDSGKSFTQLEYERAEKASKTVLIYLADEKAAIFPYSAIDVDDRRLALDAFKQTLREGHTVSTFTTAEDLAEKIKSDFATLLQPKAATLAPAGDEYEPTVSLIQRFLLLPKTVLGREIRLRVECAVKPFPAARELCKAFNFEYGHTIGVGIRTVRPDDKDVRRFRELYASGRRAEQLLKIVEARGEHEIYASIQFADDDISRIKGEFLGYGYYADPSDYDSGDPYEVWVAAEGKAILQFSKVLA